MCLCSDKSFVNKSMCLTLWKLFQDGTRCAVYNKNEYFLGVGVRLRISLPWNYRLRVIMSKIDKDIQRLKDIALLKVYVKYKVFTAT